MNMEKSEEQKAFEAWMLKVDGEIMAICGLSAYDLADYRYYDAFEAGDDPEDVAKEVLRDNYYPMDLL